MRGNNIDLIGKAASQLRSCAPGKKIGRLAAASYKQTFYKTFAELNELKGDFSSWKGVISASDEQESPSLSLTLS